MIGIRNFTSNKIDEKFVKKIIEEILKGEGIKDEIEISIVFLGPGRMKEVNKRYKGRNRVTDILSFPETEIIFQGLKVGPKKVMRGLGEILICPRVLKKNTKRFNTTFKEELSRVLIHGTLHLLGYDHQEEQDRKRMEEKEKEYLSKFLK